MLRSCSSACAPSPLQCTWSSPSSAVVCRRQRRPRTCILGERPTSLLIAPAHLLLHCDVSLLSWHHPSAPLWVPLVPCMTMVCHRRFIGTFGLVGAFITATAACGYLGLTSNRRSLLDLWYSKLAVALLFIEVSHHFGNGAACT